MTLLNKVLWSKRQVSDQMPKFNEHKFKDPVVESIFSCTVAIPCKPWSQRMEKWYNLELLKLQKGADEAWTVQINTDASKGNFENICSNQIKGDMNAVQTDFPGKTLESQLLDWSVSSFLLLCTSFCFSYSCITFMLLHRELDLSMLLKYLS